MEEFIVGIGTMPQWIQVGYGVVIGVSAIGLYIHEKYRKTHPKMTKEEKAIQKAKKYADIAQKEHYNESKKD